jgi:hypothetical protein
MEWNGIIPHAYLKHHQYPLQSTGPREEEANALTENHQLVENTYASLYSCAFQTQKKRSLRNSQDGIATRAVTELEDTWVSSFLQQEAYKRRALQSSQD